VHVSALVLIGFVFRATFITKGFNATDEGWLQSVGRRITLGEVPYRDFDFIFPPVSIYKEAALQALLGDSYTMLVSRWVFVAEATLGSVLASLIIRRFVGSRLAFLATLPTVFFSVLHYYFSNYTYDGEALLLASVLLLVEARPNRRWLAFAAGAAACGATLSKPSFGAFVLLVPLIGVVGSKLNRRDIDSHPALVGIHRLWPLFLYGAALTFGAVLALFAAVGAARQFLEGSFVGATQEIPQSLAFTIWQDLPTAFSSGEVKLFGLVFALLAIAALPKLTRLRWFVTLCVPVVLVVYSLKYLLVGGGFIPMAMGLLLVINLAALLISLAVRTPYLRSGELAEALRDRLPPPELIVLALALQYLAQFTFSGIIYSYLGAYLSLPVAVLLLRGLSDVRLPNARTAIASSLAMVAPVLFGAWIMFGSIEYVRYHVYFDAPRGQLTAAFQTPKLAGIVSTPANVQRVDGVVTMVDRYSRPGDPILVIPDFGCLYFLTDRVNPTRRDWMIEPDLAPSVVDSVLRDIEQRPPKVVFLQSVSEYDWSRSLRPEYVIDYPNSRKARIYKYLLERYEQVATVDDIAVLVPRGST